MSNPDISRQYVSEPHPSLSKKRKSASKAKARLAGKSVNDLPAINSDAAGADIGAREIVVCVPPCRDTKSVRTFATFTEGLHQLADWLEKCGVRSIAMESTGMYWIPLHQILEARGIEVLLVNARHVPPGSGGALFPPTNRAKPYRWSGNITGSSAQT